MEIIKIGRCAGAYNADQNSREAVVRPSEIGGSFVLCHYSLGDLQNISNKVDVRVLKKVGVQLATTKKLNTS